MKFTACISIIALGLAVAGPASAHSPRPDYDAFYAVGAQPGPNTTGTATHVLPREQDERETLSGGPVGGLPDRN